MKKVKVKKHERKAKLFAENLMLHEAIATRQRLLKQGRDSYITSKRANGDYFFKVWIKRKK